MKKILIVDDSIFMRNILKDILLADDDEITLMKKLEFYEADGKTNALKQINKQKPDVILLDIVMQESEKEGIELLEAIKDSFDIKKVIIISSIGQDEIIDKCNELGVGSYIQKPVENRQVKEAVNQIIK